MAGEDSGGIKLSSVFTFVASAAAGYFLMLPLETYVDAARTAIMHSTSSELLVNSAASGPAGDIVNGLRDWLTGSFTSEAAAAAYTPDAGAIETLTQTNGLSADSVFGGP